MRARFRRPVSIHQTDPHANQTNNGSITEGDLTMTQNSDVMAIDARSSLFANSQWDKNENSNINVPPPPPSSLRSFATPRKPIGRISKAEDKFVDPSPREVVQHGSGGPFRDRFASAAIVSQQQDARAQVDLSKNIFFHEENISENVVSPLTEKSMGGDEKYVSLGNQSVCSDITDAEATGMSPRRSPRRRGLHAATSLSPRKQLFKVSEEVDDNYREEDLLGIKDEAVAVVRSASDGSKRLESLGGAREKFNDGTKTQEFLAAGKEKAISPRLAAFFSNMSLSGPRNRGSGEGGQIMARGDVVMRSQSDPAKKYGIRSYSPVKSSASESSGDYVGWPGTLDRNGNTVKVSKSASFTSDEDGSKPNQAFHEAPPSTGAFAEHVSKIKQPLHHAVKLKRLAPQNNQQINRNAISKRRVPAIRPSMAELRRKFESTKKKDIDKVDLDVKPESKPSDYHLAAAISKATSRPSASRLNLSYDGIIPSDHSSEHGEENLNRSFPGASRPSLIHDRESDERGRQVSHNIDTSASLRRVQSAGKTIGRRLRTMSKPSTTKEGAAGTMRLSEATLEANNRFTSTLQNIAHGSNVKGYRGFINKTADIPNLMDDEIDSVTSASTIATNRRKDKSDGDSDVFDGVSSDQSDTFKARFPFEKKAVYQSRQQRNSLPKQIPEEEIDNGQINIVHVQGTITSVQTTPRAFESRRTSVELDAALTESDTDYVHQRKRRSSPAIIPGHYDLVASQKRSQKTLSYSSEDSGNSGARDDSDYDSIPCNLSRHAVDSAQVRKLIRAYRKMNELFTNNGTKKSLEEQDAKQAFALFEMRSRIMETDLERGFDRAGGTVAVDDIVLTPFYKESCRVRDVVIVSKAWKDGASPEGVRTASNLTKGFCYHIRRSSRVIHSTGSNSSDSFGSLSSEYNHLQVSLERVGWIDDTEFSLIRCFGEKTLRGSDIFTVGDCQSMLLKLTFDYCENLKKDLRHASSRMLVAEQMMKDEGGHSSSMTDAELEYLSEMEEVKTLTSNLAKAEKAFDMVRSEIESLVQKYEIILEEINNENDSLSSFNSAAASDVGDEQSDSSGDSKYEKERLARRVQRAELKAEVSAREAQIAKVEAEKSKQEAELIQIQKNNELDELKQKLEELEAKSAIMASDYESKLQSQALMADLIVPKQKESIKNGSFFESPQSQSLLYAASSTVGTDPDQCEAKERVKAKFRQRRTKTNADKAKDESNANSAGRQKLGRVHQRLEFYERSLQSISDRSLQVSSK